ncbi:MAG: hypothetical protein U0235_19110 [Polyangiaceae bacterium]
MGKSDQPPSQQQKDMIVMTRLNTVGLKRLAEGTLVEKRPFESRPPEPMRVGSISEPPIVPPPSRAAAVPTLLEEDELGADAGEDRTVALGADGSEDRTVAAPVRAPAPPQTPPLARAEAAPASVAPASKGKLDIETPTALFVKDIQRTLQEELTSTSQRVAGERKQTPSAAPAALGFAETIIDARADKAEPKVDSKKEKPADKPAARTEPALSKSASVPAPPATKSAALTAPTAQKSSGALPAPLPAQASRRKDPVAVSVSTRPRRIERKGGFVPWAAALTALGVFVGVAGARVATGAPFLRAAAAPVAAPAAQAQAEPAGFAPKVAMPATPKAEEPAPVAQDKPAEKVEAKVEETKPVEAKAETKTEAKPTEAKPAEPAKVAEAKPSKDEAKPAETKPEPRVERPRPHRPAPAAAAPSEEKVAKAEPKPEKVEKPEPAPKPAKTEGKKSPDVAAAARDYANVDSTLGPSL